MIFERVGVSSKSPSAGASRVFSIALDVMLRMPLERPGGSPSRTRTRIWTRSPRVQIAKATVAGDYIRHAFLDRTIAAIPRDGAHVEIYHRPPGPVARGMTHRNGKYRARRQAGGDNRKFDCRADYFASF